MHQKLIRLLLLFLKITGINEYILNIPVRYLTVQDWLEKRKDLRDARFVMIEKGKKIVEIAPTIVGHDVSLRFAKYFNRTTKDIFVAVVPKGRVLGEECNIIITPDNVVLSDVSREFGAEGGKRIEDFSVLSSRLRVPPLKKLKGNVAVISTCGSSNFHHWNFDVLPRVEMLKYASLFDTVDFFLINYQGLPFQREGLRKLQLDESKIINSANCKNFHIQAELLFIPSLTEDLGTINPWVIEFLRRTFLNERKMVGIIGKSKFYISRRSASSRKFINNEEVMNLIYKSGFVELIPEDYTIEQVASFFANASSVISIHGSGLSNLPFINENTGVLDIMASFHQDPYYWMICNQRKSKYVGLFSEGIHPPDNLDLVKNKRDDDLYIDCEKLGVAIEHISPYRN